MLSVTQLTKDFGRIRALDAVSVEMYPGQAISLIGPNGSGKTTLIKCILGLVLPDNGLITLNGDGVIHNCDYRQNIGYMPQIGRYPDNMRVGQVLEMVKELRQGLYERLDDDLILAFNLSEFIHKPMRTLSGGMRQKVSACLAFLFDPDVLILDEPTAGLDPVSVEILKEKVRAEKKQGKLILLTSHILSDLDDLATDVLYLTEGKVHFYSPIAELRKETGENSLQRAVAFLMKKQYEKIL